MRIRYLCRRKRAQYEGEFFDLTSAYGGKGVARYRWSRPVSRFETINIRLGCGGTSASRVS